MIDYKITPLDIANYIILGDMKLSQQNEVITTMFNEYRADLSDSSCQDLKTFTRTVMGYLTKYELSDDELNAASLILGEAASRNELDLDDENNMCDAFAEYFKIIKLQIIFSPKQSKYLKLRTILREFGYQRRTPNLIKNISDTLEALNIETYLKGYEQCRFCDIELDETVILRLRPDWHTQLIKGKRS